MQRLGVAVLLVLLAVAAAGWESDVELAELPGTRAGVEPVQVRVVRDHAGWRTLVAHVAIVADPARQFSVLQPPGGCRSGIRATPAETSSANGVACDVATNAGFFSVNNRTAPLGTCLGATVAGGVWAAPGDDQKHATFGIRHTAPQGGSDSDGDDDAEHWRQGTHHPQLEFVVGYPNEAELRGSKWRHLVTGGGWIVRGGRSNVRGALEQESWSYQSGGGGAWFAGLQAPRLSLGHDAEGRVLLVAVDGDEPWGEGADLYALADLMVSLGAVNAVNLDGGGSVAMFVNRSTIVNVPSNVCPGDEESGPRYMCPRGVASVVCLRGDGPMPFTDSPSQSLSRPMSRTGGTRSPAASASSTLSTPRTATITLPSVPAAPTARRVLVLPLHTALIMSVAAVAFGCSLAAVAVVAPRWLRRPRWAFPDPAVDRVRLVADSGSP